MNIFLYKYGKSSNNSNRQIFNINPKNWMKFSLMLELLP